MICSDSPEFATDRSRWKGLIIYHKLQKTRIMIDFYRQLWKGVGWLQKSRLGDSSAIMYSDFLESSFEVSSCSFLSFSLGPSQNTSEVRGVLLWYLCITSWWKRYWALPIKRLERFCFRVGWSAWVIKQNKTTTSIRPRAEGVRENLGERGTGELNWHLLICHNFRWVLRSSCQLSIFAWLYTWEN